MKRELSSIWLLVCAMTTIGSAAARRANLRRKWPRTISKVGRMSTAKQQIAIVASAMLLLSGCANQGGGQVRSIPSTTDYTSEPIPSTTIPGNTNLGKPPMLSTSTATGR
jgi:hypothetical protein